MENLTPNETKALLWVLGTVMTVLGSIVVWLFSMIMSYGKKIGEDMADIKDGVIKNESEIKIMSIKHDSLVHRVTYVEKTLDNFRQKKHE